MKVSKKVADDCRKKPCRGDFSVKSATNELKAVLREGTEDKFNPAWNYVLLFIAFVTMFSFLFYHLSTLQVAQGKEMLEKSKNNQIRIRKDTAFRGVIMDRNGKILAQNAPSMNVYLSVEKYLDEKGYVDTGALENASNTLGGIIGDLWKDKLVEQDEQFSSISEKIYSTYDKDPYFTEILVARNVDNEMAIKIKAASNELPGVYVDSGSKREYIGGEAFTHILGYTGSVTAEDLEKLDYVDSTDIVGRTGLEKTYDKRLIGEDGQIAWEVDAMGRMVEDEGYTLKEPIAGENLYLTIDADLQKKAYEVLEESVAEYGAVGGAVVIEEVETGELLTLTSYPSYNNNLFVGGISQKEFDQILSNPGNPLLDRSIAAQMPPGSVFKPLVAAGALDAGAIKKNTVYVSRRGYTFSAGAPFQEYQNNAYGSLNLIDAISVSSNIYFCELIRNWDMNELVPYLEKFGIGKITGVDIPGEAEGRLPSPANKAELSKYSPWLEPVWYPEGDSCNSVIGQGITLVTPIQMANWTAAIANGGRLNTPHLAGVFENEKKEKSSLEVQPLGENIISTDSLKIVREGMWSAVNGPRATIGGVAGIPGVSVAAKTGTAEFGKLNKKGEYEHTHAWVTTFFPAEDPKYVLTIFLEDGGQSYNAVKSVREIIIWMQENL